MLELLSDRVRPFNATYSLIGKFASLNVQLFEKKRERERARFYRKFYFGIHLLDSCLINLTENEKCKTLT